MSVEIIDERLLNSLINAFGGIKELLRARETMILERRPVTLEAGLLLGGKIQIVFSPPTPEEMAEAEREALAMYYAAKVRP